MNSAMNTGKHCLKRAMMLWVLCLRDFGVSNNAKGNVSTKNVAMAATAIAILETPKSRVTSRNSENTTNTTTERNA